jgi:predicted RNA binding protein YcfA (HicA-like mRNA interferase family)
MDSHVLTYGRLDNRLRALGFVVRTEKGTSRIYRHEQTGAKVFLPDTGFEAEVTPHHLVAVRHVLQEHELGNLYEGQICPMPDRSELAWRVFLLGVRLASAFRSDELSSEEISSLVGQLRRIADSEQESIFSMGSQSVKVDRDLAATIVRGLEGATGPGNGTDAAVGQEEKALHGAAE